MGRKPADLSECCEILGVSPSASAEDMRLAFALNRRELEMAGYDVQAVRKMVESEDDRAAMPSPAPAVRAVSCAMRKRTAIKSITLLWGLLALLMGTAWLFVWPKYGYKMRSFNSKDVLVEARTGKPYATVLEVSQSHKFPNGKMAPAYRLKMSADGNEVWYPVNDVHYLCIRE